LQTFNKFGNLGPRKKIIYATRKKIDFFEKKSFLKFEMKISLKNSHTIEGKENIFVFEF
jgi:hypothetical protein